MLNKWHIVNVYVKQQKFANSITSYECEHRKGAGKGLSECRARVKLNEDLSVVGFLNEHTHLAVEARGECYKYEKE
jgi:hypothetical protein